jgi:hypothetical protein
MRRLLVALLASAITSGALVTAPTQAATTQAAKTYLMSLEGTGPGEYVPYGIVQVQPLSSSTGTWDIASRGISGGYSQHGLSTIFYCTATPPTIAYCEFAATRGLFVAYRGTYTILSFEGPPLGGKFIMTARL